MTRPPLGPVLAPARIRYLHDQPFSLDYQDIYHAGDGAAEVQRVFVEPCGIAALARRRAGMGDPARAPVRIGELGFGSGYNFVIAAEQCLSAGARLHFLSFEAHPIDGPDFAAIARQRAAAHPLYAELARRYPPRIRGWHRRYLAGGRVCLSLWWGSAADGLADIDGRQGQPVDAWFLDGFAPDRNPDMWDAELFAHLAALSGRDTRIATFTAAGRVRRGLASAGFAMGRVDQRPHKRESLAGSYQGTGLAGFPAPREVVIAGAGLAGASAARHLADAGCAVRLLDDPAPADMAPASLTPVTVLHGRLLGDGSPAAALRCHGYLYAAALAAELTGFRATGVVQLAGGTQGEDKLAGLHARYGGSGDWLRYLDAESVSALAGYAVNGPGLYFPGGGVVATPELIAGLARHPNVEQVASRLEVLPADRAVILACGPATRRFTAARYLELAPVAGQVDFVTLAEPPGLPLVGSGYLVPDGDQVAAGATYEYRPWEPAEASRANLAQLQGRAYTWRSRHRGTRSVSSDRTAIAGLLYDRQGAPLPGHYVTTGHGSSGNVSAPFAAALLAARILGDFPPLARELEAAMSPLRFRERQARRGYRHGATD